LSHRDAGVSDDIDIERSSGPFDRKESNMSGEMDQAKGRMKQAVGDLTDDKDLKAEGKADETGGKVKDKFDDAVDSVKDKVDRK
jgi:uncharacterized protein YjbJ (UPF0337 family)